MIHIDTRVLDEEGLLAELMDDVRPLTLTPTLITVLTLIIVLTLTAHLSPLTSHPHPNQVALITVLGVMPILVISIRDQVTASLPLAAHPNPTPNPNPNPRPKPDH